MTTAVDTETMMVSTPQQTPSSELGWMAKLPQMLRGLGAAVVVLSLYGFLMKGWEGSNDLVRYLMLLGHTGILALMALASGHFLKEGKGARLLLILAQISVVVNFAILGAFVFSTTTVVDVNYYPKSAAWTVDHLSTALITLFGASTILLPVIWVSFRALARGMSNKLSLFFIFSNCILLVPMRDPIWIACITLVIGALTLSINIRNARQRAEAKTTEGMIVLLLQFLPLSILLVRNIWLYSPELVLFPAGAMLLFIALRQAMHFVDTESYLGRAIEGSSVTAAMSVGISTFLYMAVTGQSVSLAMSIASILSGGLIYEVSLRSQRNAALFRIIASTTVTLGLLANLAMFGGTLASIAALFIGILMVIQSYMLQQRAIFIGGVILTLGGLCYQLTQLLQYFDFGTWMVLAFIGMLAILSGSFLEAKGIGVKTRLQHWKHQYSRWSY